MSIIIVVVIIIVPQLSQLFHQSHRLFQCLSKFSDNTLQGLICLFVKVILDGIRAGFHVRDHFGTGIVKLQGNDTAAAMATSVVMSCLFPFGLPSHQLFQHLSKFSNNALQALICLGGKAFLDRIRQQVGNDFHVHDHLGTGIAKL
jgi:hypothetical protein